MLNFNWFDVILALVIVMSGLAGLKSGLARVIVNLCATIVGLLLAFWSYGLLASAISPWIPNPTVARVLAFLMIFIGIVLIGAIIAAVLSKLFKWVGLSWFNHFLGGIAGFLRGVLFIAVIADVVIAFTPTPAPEFLENSRVLPYASEVATTLADLAPRDLRQSFEQGLLNLKHHWHLFAGTSQSAS